MNRSTNKTQPMQFLKSQYDTSNNKPNIIFQMFSKLFFQF